MALPRKPSLSGEMVRAVLNVALTLVVAGVPGMYSIDPGLTTRSGFWRDNRPAVVGVGIVAVAVVLLSLEVLQARRIVDRLLEYRSISQDLTDAVDQLTTTVEGQQRETARTTVRTQFGDAQAAMMSASDAASQIRNRVSPLPPFPAGTTLVVLVERPDELGFAAVLPPMYGNPDGPTKESTALANVLQARSVIDRRSVRCIPIAPAEAQFLPPALRDTLWAATIPLYGELGRVIGVGCVVFSSADLAGPDSNGLIERAISWAEAVQPFAGSIHQALSSAGELAPAILSEVEA